MNSNFDFLKAHDEVFHVIATNAEKAFVPDPNTTLYKVRQLGEAFAQDIASRLNVDFDEMTSQVDLLRKIQYAAQVPREPMDTFHAIRKLGNEATHGFVSQHREAISALKLARVLSIWFHRTFGNPPASWKPGSFVTPPDPAEDLRTLEEQIEALKRAQAASQQQLKIKEQLAKAEAEKAKEAQAYAKSIEEERDTWEEIAREQEAQYVEAQERFNATTKARMEFFKTEPEPQAAEQVAEAAEAIQKSYWQEDEAETRLRIDQQLSAAGWQADTVNLRYSKGARPEPNKNKAIAEWPTSSGPADYVLFVGLTPIATVEAKRASKNVAADIDQAERYSKSFQATDEVVLPGGPWLVDDLKPEGETYKIPFAFATNGRPFLEQHKEVSGIWFRDCRRPQNLRRANDGWYSPEGLQELFKQDINAAETALQQQSFVFDFKLREYQIKAIKAAEQAIVEGKHHILLAMATGTGKTKTCIALVYRLLQAQRFRRILFLVDRSALGEQTEDAFESTQMLNQQTFSDTFNIKGLNEATVETATQVHIATVQGMVKRILYSDGSPPTVDQYDCIVIDECHRGYLIDRELTDVEITFRSEKDYISKYRRVIDYFDAVKIGLTATPALHTVEIFGEPVFYYRYAEAVIDGYLVDHEPPIHIKTKHNQDGVKYRTGEELKAYNADRSKIQLFRVEDELDFDISKINRTLEDESFNKLVCQSLAAQIDFFGEEKTLIFCVTDQHADMVVRLLSDAIADIYGSCEDGLVKKITGTSHKPLDLIKHYKNERLPSVAVTVDLLTTGVDVTRICHLVFLRPVKSRILYEQMKGRATRLCPEINKEAFHIYDAVNLFDNLEPLTDMKPVVVNPSITFAQLEKELTEKQTEGHKIRERARDQFLAKLQRKKHSGNDEWRSGFETIAGQSPEDFVSDLSKRSEQEVADWFIQHPGLGEFLDRQHKTEPPIIFITEKQDELIDVETSYGETVEPKDYLQDFERFIKDNENKILALKTLIHQPGKITRQQVKELLMELSDKQFTEQNLRRAWAMESNQDIAARIVGYVRKAALGDALVPWEQRVDNAINVILNQQSWKPAQKNLLKAIGELLKSRLALDEHSINESALSRKYGNFARINSMFDNQLPAILEAINDSVWQDSAG